MNGIQKKTLLGDILKSLHYQSAYSNNTSLGSLVLWTMICEAGHHEAGEHIKRDALEGHVNELAEKGLVEKTIPPALGGLLTDYQLHLTRKGKGLVLGEVEVDPDIVLGEV